MVRSEQRQNRQPVLSSKHLVVCLDSYHKAGGYQDRTWTANAMSLKCVFSVIGSPSPVQVIP